MIRPQSAIFDVVILGGGPAGLGAALMLGRACRQVVVIDAGHPRNAAARQIHGFLGHDGIRPQELLNAGRKEVERYGVRLIAGEAIKAKRLERSPEQPFATAFSIRTRDGDAFVGRKLLFATGMRDELPELPGLRECYGVTVHHCPYCDGWEHRDKPIVVYGAEIQGAVGLALAVRGWTKDVTVLSNGRVIDEQQRGRLSLGQVGWAEEEIVRLVHQGNQLRGVELAKRGVLSADALFFHTRQRRSSDLARSLGASCDDEFTGRTTRKQTTDVPGLFIAGDADGNVEFAIVAAGEGAIAAVAINHELQEEDRALWKLPGVQ